MKPGRLFGPAARPENINNSSRFGRGLVLISFGLAAILLYLAFRNLDWDLLWQTIMKALYGYLPIAFLWASLSYLIRAWRLRILLLDRAPVHLQQVFWANMAGYLGNLVLPARAGELVRAAYLGQREDVGTSFALAAGLVERLVDLIALIVIGSIALSRTGLVSPVMQAALISMSLIAFAGLIAVFLLPRFKSHIEHLLLKLPFLKEVQKLRVSNFLDRFFEGLKSLHGTLRLLQFVSLTGLIWFVDALGAVLLGFILKIPLLLSHAFVLLASLGISSAIPSTPGYVGVFQFVAVTVLEPFGISQAGALAYILVSQLFGYGVIGFWGLVSLARLRGSGSP